MAIGKREDSESVRITSAATSRREEMDGRVRAYLISMAIRLACFVGAVAVGPGWLRWVLMAGAVFMPYVAVVMANAVRSSDEQPMETGLTHRELEGQPSARPLHSSSSDATEDRL